MKYLCHLTLLAAIALTGAPAHAQSCKAGQAVPEERYAVGPDGTVTDTRTGLVWMRCPLGMSPGEGGCVGSPVAHEWQSARRAIERINGQGGFAGASDWRLPTREELAGLVRSGCTDPAIDAKAFPATPPTGFWSATPEVGYDRGAWLVYFRHGQAYMGNVQQQWLVRAVRPAR